MPYFSDDDIAQICTPPGHAPVGALRVSGPNAFSIVAGLTPSCGAVFAKPARLVHDGFLALPLSRVGQTSGEKRRVPCPARFFLMPAPASYTREDVVEIHLSGAPALLRAALAALVANGARAAAPGEFTFRAFRNGRLSLGQAEAVETVVRAANDAERRHALARLGDRGMEKVANWRGRLMDVAAGVEAALDFSEEELDDDVLRGLGALSAELEREGAGIARQARDISDGLPVVALVGVTNAGKSSLYNALAEDDAALVSPEASTTRDTLRREISAEGTRFVLADNPGYDPGSPGGPGRAAARAFAALGGENLACWVVDASVPLAGRAREFVRGLSGGVVVALNKSDLPSRVDLDEIVEAAGSTGVPVAAAVSVSAATGEGVRELRGALARAVRSLAGGGAWSRREILELSAARESCRAAARELNGPGRLELVAEDLRRAAAAFSRMFGEGYAEEALGRIFSRFCIGK